MNEKPEKFDYLSLVKATLGYSTTVRDELLKATIESVVKELIDNQGIPIDEKNSEHTQFVVDLAVFRYENKGAGSMPRQLTYRLRNLIINYGGRHA